MRTEVPVLRRCCFCLPLRHGLLVWGYFKLILTSMLLFYFFVSLYALIVIYSIFKLPFGFDVLVLFGIFLIVIMDFTLQIIFVIGAHMKNVKLMRVYYIYSLILAILTFLLLVGGTGMMMKGMFLQSTDVLGIITVSNLSALFVNLVFQAYIILLVRSEIIKLKNNFCFKFVNNAAEAECNLVIEEIYAKKETSKIDDVEKMEDDCGMVTYNIGNDNSS